MMVLLADTNSPLSWETLKFVLPLLLTVITASVPFGVWLGRRYYWQRLKIAERNAEHHEDAHDRARADAEKYQADAAKWHEALLAKSEEAGTLAQELQAVQANLHATEKDRQTIFRAGKKIYLERNSLKDSLQQTLAKHQQLLQASGSDKTQLEEQTKINQRLQRRMRTALKLEGQLWNAKALQGRPAFRPLEQRQRAIVSVLNLKGGVGKTTVTAHLGRALAVRGYRVLLVDMDLQGSLTTMMLSLDKLKQAVANEQLIQHFLNRASDDKRTKITDYAYAVFKHVDGGSIDIVGTSDSLAYAELNLTMRWLLGTGTRDTRFLLRKALHLLGVSKKYDIVLIDCPPLVNISCVNALAASDFVLIPTTMGRKSRERVPPTIRRVLRSEKFLKYVNHDLKVLGVLANCTFRWGSFTNLESSDWEQLRVWCRDAMGGQDVRLFESLIADTREMREYEAAFAMPGLASRVAQAFSALTDEIEEALPRECRRTAKSSS